MLHIGETVEVEVKKADSSDSQNKKISPSYESLSNTRKKWAEETIKLSKIEKYSKQLTPLRGEVWIANLGENVGSEENKMRPFIIIQNNVGNKFAPTVIGIPVSHSQNRLPTHTTINPEDFKDVSTCEGNALAEQIRVISKARLRNRVGMLDEATMKEIDESILVSLGFKEAVRTEKNIQKESIA